MERTGDRAIDPLITSYLTTDFAQELRDPKFSYGKCVGASNKFLQWLDDLGLTYEARARSDVPEAFGYQDRPIKGCATHHVVIIVGSDYQYMVDFTATQYGYSEHPMVQRRDADGNWVREWQ